jgi:chromosome partitioning protein
MKSIAFFNNKGGVGKTTLVYHIAYMMTELGYRVLVADLDPQANLSSMFLSEAVLYERIEEKKSILQALLPLIKGVGDVEDSYLEKIDLSPKKTTTDGQDVYSEKIDNNLFLIIGDLELSTFEDQLSDSWGKCNDGRESAFRHISAFYRIIEQASEAIEADFALIDVGPNFGAINRAALISADNIIVPVSADLFSIQGISSVGKILKDWRQKWKQRLGNNPDPTLSLPKGIMNPIGYIVSQHGVRESRPVRAYSRWLNRIPYIYSKSILDKEIDEDTLPLNDENCLGLLKHYRSLIAMSMEVSKPIFSLKSADGAIGSHNEAVQRAYSDFKDLTKKIIERAV